MNTTSDPFDSYKSTLPSYQETTAPWKLVSPEAAAVFDRYCRLVLFPLVGIIGILGSLASGIVLKKNGLDKSSNILLFVLAIADVCCLIATVDIGYIVLQVIPRWYPDWEISYTASYVLYIILMFCTFSSRIGSPVSTYTIVLITVERFIAVFFPLRFLRIVTPKRVWIAIGIVVMMWLPWACFHMTWYDFKYIHFPVSNTSAPLVVGSEVFNDVGVDLVLTFSNHLSHLIPFIIVTAGSLIISLKIGITLRQRRQLTHGNLETKVSTNRTNRILLMICFVFSVTRLSFYLQYLPWLSYDPYSTLWNNVWVVYATIRLFLVYLNSSVNFFIYVGLNKKFRTTFKDLWQFTKRSRPPIRSALASKCL